MKRTLIIVPTYNEVDNVEPLVDKIFASSAKSHVLFVDDNSRDGTSSKIKGLMTRFPEQVFILERQGKLGLGTAYLAGFRWGLERDYQILIEMDADHSHNPKEVPVFIAKLESADAVVGSRYIDGGSTLNWSWYRKLISRFGSLYARTILGLSIRDLTGGYNAWTAETIRAINPERVKSEGYCFQIELKYRAVMAGKKVIESPIIFEERRAGHSKMSFRIVLEAMTKVWSLKRMT